MSKVDLRQYVVVLTQLALLCAAIHLLEIEQGGGLPQVALLALAGFAVHALLPHRAKAPWFLAVSLAAAWLVLGNDALWLVGLGLGLFGLCAAMGWLSHDSGPAATLMLLPALVFWMWALWVVIRFPRPLPWGRRGWFMALLGVLALVLPWLAVVILHGSGEQGPIWVLVMMIVIWTADSTAYFAGRRWGRRKLAPAVSPGKTWEGLWGALVVVSLGLCGLAWWLGEGLVTGLSLLLLGLIVTLASVLGDLFESVLKRTRGVKDSGNLLPGHGGMLDRIDGFTAAAPLFTLGILAWSPVSVTG